MNKRTWLIILLILIIFGILIYSFLSQKSKLIGNPDVLEEISRLEQKSILDENGNRNIIVDDLTMLQESVKEDAIAESYVDDLEWLLAHNESEHLLHITTFLTNYIKTGTDTPCVPHAIWHIGLYLKYGDLDRAHEEIEGIDSEYTDWIENIDKKRDKYPQYYLHFDELDQKVKDAITKLHTQDFSNETISELEVIGAEGIC